MMEKIDFVITWVDSSDEKWLKKKNNSLISIGKPMEDSAGDQRYRDYGTLKYLLRSIEKYADWVNKIYLITDNQKPTWMINDLKETKLQIVDHSEIIPKDALPTFNSNAIEMCINNIPNLSENFVVFNDDWLINKKVAPEDFFYNGHPRDFRMYKPFVAYSVYDQLQFNDTLAINKMFRKKGRWPLVKKGLFSFKYPLKGNIRNLYFRIDGHGKVSNYVMSHNALSFTKTNYHKVKNIWQQEVIDTIHKKFRSPEDVTISLFRNYQLEKGKFSVRSPKFSQYFVLNESESICKELAHSKHSLLCINDADTQNYEADTRIVQNALEKKFGSKSNFEK